MNEICLPGKKDSDPQSIEIEKSVVIIGANGSGKTRFSAQIENGFISEVHRITALKNLEFSEEIRREGVVSAEHLFRWGVLAGAFGPGAYPKNKVKHRYNNDSITKPLNDFPVLLSLLFAYHQQSQDVKNISSKLESVLSIWESVIINLITNSLVMGF
jgi:adenylate kinase family enzyme